MRITKRQLKRIIKEEMAMATPTDQAFEIIEDQVHELSAGGMPDSQIRQQLNQLMDEIFEDLDAPELSR